MLQNFGPTICLWLEKLTFPSQVKSRTDTRLKPREAPGADPRSTSPERDGRGAAALTAALGGEESGTSSGRGGGGAHPATVLDKEPPEPESKAKTA